ncbi:hypothetical protein [uncultured Tateyamaria sp.]|uniref:hypothetical protein n=1 Tax=uncultured Tateyamaria sp. TaxID=455651 RepID=UPI00262730D7|nr:hypothetical protein [uncultured Tateyamaria sp.]
MTSTENGYTLTLDYGTEAHRVSGDNSVILRMLGQDHHKAAKIKPRLTITNDVGDVVAEMDEWATVWTEGRGV